MIMIKMTNHDISLVMVSVNSMLLENGISDSCSWATLKAGIVESWNAGTTENDPKS